MNEAQIIANAFPPGADHWGVLDDFIIQNPNLMEIGAEVNYLRYVPAYMDWCIRNKDNYDQLITDYTINALAEYGRCNNEVNSYLNFKFLCNDRQKQAVLAFYRWCLKNLEVADETQITRSMKHWS